MSQNLNQIPDIPLFIAEDDELGPLKNDPGNPLNRPLISSQKIGEGYLKTDLKSVQYGSYRQQDACLLILESTFHPWNSEGSIWKHVKLVITFNEMPTAGQIGPDSRNAPIVLALEALATSDTTPTAESDAWSQYEKDQHSDILNQAVFVSSCGSANEKGRDKAQVFLRAAIVVKHNRRFQARFEYNISAKIWYLNMKMGITRKLTGKLKNDDPVLFDSTAPMGFGLKDNDLTKIVLKDLLRPVVEGEKKKETGRDITKKNTGTGKAFRITKIPLTFTIDDVQKTLCPLSPATVVVGSLAPDADSLDSVSYQVATAMFEPLEPPFLDLQQDHPMKCTYEDIEGHLRSVIVDCSFYGLTTLASPGLKSETTMDLIAISGLNGHPFASWKEKGGYFMWLRDGLPHTLSNTRIMTYGYDSRLYGSASFASISSYGKSLLADIISARATPEELKRPLVFIGHSLGGLLIKEALVQSSRADSADKSVFDSTHGLIFLGVPHRGLRVEHLLAMVEGQPNEEFVESLKPESPYLDTLHQDFGQATQWKSLVIHSYYETMESKTAKKVGNTWKLEGPPARLVAKSSATGARPGEQPSNQCPINLAHSEMAKFEDGNSFYKQIRNRLYDLELSALRSGVKS